MEAINFPNVSVWDRSLFKYLDKYCVMNNANPELMHRKNPLQKSEGGLNSKQWSNPKNTMSNILYFSAEIEKRKNNEKMGNAVSGIGKFAGYDTMKELLNAMMTGNFTIPTSTANSMMNSNINSSIGRDITKVPEYVNNNITNNNTPSFTINNNVQGDMSEKTADYVNNQLKQTLVDYTRYFGQEYCQEMMRRQSKL